jgi:RNA polymerase sigma-70 factor (ECF subfamily)
MRGSRAIEVGLDDAAVRDADWARNGRPHAPAPKNICEAQEHVHSSLRTFALLLSGDPTRSDELVQDTMLRAWTNQHRFQPGTNIIACLFTILRTQLYSEMRERKREVEDAGRIHAGQLTALPDQEDVVALGELYAILETLPAAQREALLLFRVEG